MGNSIHFKLNVDNLDLLRELDRLAKAVPSASSEAVDAMAGVIRPALIAAAPYDGSPSHKGQHLKDVIKRGKIKNIHGGHITSVWLKPRGLSGAKKGPRAYKNWDADKHIYKLVVAEFGRSNQKANPFWVRTVQAKSNEAVNAAIRIMQREFDKHGT